MKEGTWQNTKIVGPYTAGSNRRVKAEVDDGVYVSGSSVLVRALIADGLLDELHLFVYPVTRGAGPRLFPDDSPTQWSLAHSATYDNRGVVPLVLTAPESIATGQPDCSNAAIGGSEQMCSTDKVQRAPIPVRDTTGSK